MHSLLGRLKGLLQSLFVLVPLCLDCQSVLASSSRFAGCDPDINEVVRIGLPERYQGELDSEAGFELVGGSCVIFTYGNDYQLLEWFENGKIDASVLTEVSLSLLSNDVAENQYEYTDTWPITNAPLNKNTYALRYSQELDWASDPVTAFGDTLADKSALPVYVPSHLSPGFFYLLQHTKRWFDGETNPLDKDERARFWESFLTRIRFSLDWDINSQSHDDFFEVVLIQSKDVAAKCSDAQYHCFGEYVQQDYFVTRKPRKYARLQGTLTKDISMSDWVSSFDQWLKDLGLNADDDLYVALRDFKDSNYPSQELGSRVRRNFHFTIDELFQFLTDDRAEQSDLGFGLVLAGGGVKAAYQSHLVDHLYSNGYLVNTSPAQTIETDQSRESLTVDYVIGTSGGALLGVFVSSLDGHRTQSLSESIWQLNRGKDGTDQQFIQSSDIFPLVDMLRYLSLLVTGVIFGCAIFFIAKRRERSGARQVQVGGKARNAASKTWAGEDFVWIILLLIAPWVIKVANGSDALEHVPYVAGFFYTAYVAIFLYSDNKLDAIKTLRFSDVTYSWQMLLAAFTGVALVTLPFVFAPDAQPLSAVTDLLSISIRALFVCVGFLLLCVSYYRILYSQTGVFNYVPGKYITRALIIILAIPSICYLLMTAAHFLFGVSILELTKEFWVWFVAISILVCFLFAIYVSTWKLFPRLKRWMRSGVAFLVMDHPKHMLFISNRYARFLFCFSAAWMWWNFVSAPGLYGNQNAREYFYNVFAQFVCQEDSNYVDCIDNNDFINKSNVRFKTSFVISATSLDRNTERYFLFHHDGSGIDGRQTLSERATLDIANDPRWVQIRPGIEDKYLRTIAFASGSPFPVFPAHNVEFPEGGRTEWLVVSTAV